ncbi:RidA family protein [Planctomicrobium piriforme]|uniref:Enamine deaminase RidA, house cleaning of reactive enamine intermediates, YjgF/YER057c/UK114 family n=1 Tax=Planctomicrobium piriforme TaxID=1576369 RepID=A0A1I3RPJ2_9PLAN|nr:RidA family protein [Planctomicrobium piriforme]SFJ47191.1 Enamine deaminase RidA, house cleaning of reactive enamine intermediates, YjgF/YER057c/UK114 family [Planctomicrobium piriforme]
MTMGTREQRLQELGYPLDRVPKSGGLFDPVAVVGTLVYASGQVPFDGDELIAPGKVPTEVSQETATQAAALCAANILRTVRQQFGSLDAIERVVRITGYVNSSPDFTLQHLVMNGASKLVREVFGEQGRHARTALGVAQLPLGSSVELEMILQLKQGS